MGTMSLFDVTRVQLEAERLWPKGDDPTVVFRIEVHDKGGRSFQTTLFCSEGMPEISFGYQHKIDLPIKRTEGITAAAQIIDPWKPMDIALDDEDRPVIAFEHCILVDDGTLDTVIGIWCDHHEEHHEHRFDGESTASYRDEAGRFDLYGFWTDYIADDDSLLCTDVGEEE